MSFFLSSGPPFRRPYSSILWNPGPHCLALKKFSPVTAWYNRYPSGTFLQWPWEYDELCRHNKIIWFSGTNATNPAVDWIFNYRSFKRAKITWIWPLVLSWNHWGECVRKDNLSRTHVKKLSTSVENIYIVFWQWIFKQGKVEDILWFFLDIRLF